MNKRKFNTNAGITLVALILTVVVLIIIATVTIGTIKEEPILEHSQTAVKQFNELQFREQLELIFLSYTTASQRGLKINNKKITNKILNIFDYPNIDEVTGLVEDTVDGTVVEETWTLNSSEGLVNIKDNSTSETILQVTYDINDKPEFTIKYKNFEYEYSNYKLVNKTAD